MVRNEHEIVIHCPTSQVFGAVTDLATWNRWHGSGEAEKTTPGPVGVGTEWQATGKVQGATVVVTMEVTAYEPDRRFAFAFSGAVQGRQSFAFEPVDGGTRLVTVLEVADPQMAAPARQQWDKDLPILKRLLEGQTEGG